ncbi:enoyl-CoA hydratase [Methyloceanibacter methanicus]|uniref:Enoyl-CoA hydratase n=1 Tax=Methyloceanibacter methanicus TaxID=1774968 RepID=A0A1E3W5N1_9HYPH|nr:bifunctional enoyl-CoA hydratase/phosphate acetyltransferase [Methyloceanibacter methanicus]ODS01119.1 enoyl-CoA hydratase [Methyloceanibacter methanicus]
MIRENKLYDELNVGDTAQVKRVCTANDLYVFAHASGNLNPLHMPDPDDDQTEAVAPSMWVGALISSVLGNVLPGPGTLYRSQSLRFLDRAHVGDELTVSVTVKEKLPDSIVAMETVVTGRGGETVAEGVAEVLAPERKVSVDMEDLPEIVVQRHQHFDEYIRACEGLDPLVTAVVAPEEKESLGGALLAAEHGLIRPILIGSETLIRQAAKEAGENLGPYEIIDIPDHVAAAGKAVELVHEGQAGALMKGHLHTSDLLREILKSKGGLRTSRRMSHAFVMDVPGLDHPLIISDAAINISPDLTTKVDITQSAIDVARALGIETPKVGVLSAVETVNPQIPSTLDAAALSKMSDRGQIKGGVVDGPLAMDNAMDAEAAKTKGVTGLVAGHAEVLIVPNLEAGNMLAKELAFVAGAEAAGIALGASCPVILTSRADGEKARLASCAIAVLYRYWQEHGQPIGVRLAEAAE